MNFLEGLVKGFPVTPDLPYVDQHSIEALASREVVWAALEHQVSASLLLGPRHPLAALLGTVPRSGFEVAEREPGRRLTLTGRHRFARYRLAFVLTEGEGGVTTLTALTHAAFPGVHGRIYRMLVIDTRGHAVAVRRMLRAVRRRSMEPSPEDV